ncbi:PRKC apoptosis WT1 regulator protein-like [Pelodytes ibericus]
MSRDTKSSSTEPVPFLEEWRARRERMRLRSSSSSLFGSRSIESQSRQEEDPEARPQALLAKQEQGREVSAVKSTEATSNIQSHGKKEPEVKDPADLKNKEKKGSTQKKHRTQIEKRKLREKRRPTGLVNVSPLEDPDENQEHSDVNEGHKPQHGADQEMRKSQGIHTNRTDTGPSAPPQDNRDNGSKMRQSWMEELQEAVRGQRQDNHRLSSQLSDTEGALLVLQKEMTTVSQRMHLAQDENKRLKEENQMLLKMMGQLASQ